MSSNGGKARPILATESPKLLAKWGPERTACLEGETQEKLFFLSFFIYFITISCDVRGEIAFITTSVQDRHTTQKQRMES